MVNVLDVLETIKSSSSTPRKIAEAKKAQIETTASEAEATKHQAEIEARSSEPTKEKSLETGGETTKEAIKQILPEKTLSSTPEASSKVPDYIVRHALGKMLSEEEKREAHQYAQKLKYPKGALIFNGSVEEIFLYCLPDNKEIFVCREMARSFGFPTLEDGLSVLSKDELADSLAYNSLKVRK
jgi:ribosomal protein L13